MNCDGRCSVDHDSEVIYCSLRIPLHGVALLFCSCVEQPNLLSMYIAIHGVVFPFLFVCRTAQPALGSQGVITNEYQ